MEGRSMRDTVDGINEKAWEKAMTKEPKERRVYVLMFTVDGVPHFMTARVKRHAIKRARFLHATVYAIPYPGSGWDCPTIRATFDPIFQG